MHENEINELQTNQQAQIRALEEEMTKL